MELSLLILYSPTNFIPAVCAFMTLNKPNLQRAKTHILLHVPGGNPRTTKYSLMIIKSLAKAFPFIKEIRISLPVSGEYQNIYYPHDVVGRIYQECCSKFPRARKICFGDALGIVYEKHYHLGLFLKFSLRQKLKNFFEGYINSDKFRPDITVLVLPVDQSGKFLPKTDLRICKKELVLKVINDCVGASKIETHLTQLSKIGGTKEKYLLLTENHSEGGFINFDREILMYNHVIKKNVPEKSVIFIKPHPGETKNRCPAIRKYLGDKYQIVPVGHEYKFYPIELWKSLLRKCKVICMTYPVLSLKYLYNIDVIQPMDTEFIKRWFPEYMWDSYLNGLHLYMEPLKKLKSWDGKSVLYTGGNK